MGRKLTDFFNKLEPEDAVSSREYFKAIFKRYHLDFSKPENCVAAKWKEIAGETASSMSVCTGISKGTVFLECSHPAQMELLRLSSREICKRINSVYPELKVSKLSISVHPKASDSLY